MKWRPFHWTELTPLLHGRLRLRGLSWTRPSLVTRGGGGEDCARGGGGREECARGGGCSKVDTFTRVGY
jgi:hypothetical protein